MKDKLEFNKENQINLVVEKDKEINSLIADYEKRISQEQELMSNMEHQLTEKQNTIDEINKEFVQAVHDWKVLCVEKDKEIAELQKQLKETNVDLSLARNEIDTLKGNLKVLQEHKKIIEEQYLEKCKEFQSLQKQLEEKDKEISKLQASCQQVKTQLAIAELEKVKILIQNAISFEKPNFVEVYDVINKQIKELSNNTFKCEICGEITPKNCEGGEPNVCADCVPTKTHDLSTEIEPQSHENDFLD